VIRHCSLFKFKLGTSEELIDEILAEFRGLAEKVPSIRSATIGKNIGFHEGNFDIAANVQFESIDGYREYSVDETHLKFVDEYLMPNLEARVAVQFDLDDVAR
jgi:hypothetical protein